MKTFQSAPPHGGRPRLLYRNPSAPSCFNPRPRTGGDVPEHDRCRH